MRASRLWASPANPRPRTRRGRTAKIKTWDILAERLRFGLLRKSHQANSAPTFSVGGTAVDVDLVHHAIEAGWVTPADFGLFYDDPDNAQTFILKEHDHG